jgi:hypothetical protein
MRCVSPSLPYAGVSNQVTMSGPPAGVVAPRRRRNRRTWWSRWCCGCAARRVDGLLDGIVTQRPAAHEAHQRRVEDRRLRVLANARPCWRGCCPTGRLPTSASVALGAHQGHVAVDGERERQRVVAAVVRTRSRWPNPARSPKTSGYLRPKQELQAAGVAVSTSNSSSGRRWPPGGGRPRCRRTTRSCRRTKLTCTWCSSVP